MLWVLSGVIGATAGALVTWRVCRAVFGDLRSEWESDRIAEANKLTADRDDWKRCFEEADGARQHAEAELKAAQNMVKVRDKDIEDLKGRIKGHRDATDARDDKLAYLVEWVEAEVKPLIRARRGT